METHIDNKAFICIDCIKDSKLKKYFSLQETEKAICTFCKINNNYCLEMERNTDFINIVRALVRYHYWEDEYNHHFGGLRFYELITSENFIFNSERFIDDVDLDILTCGIEDCDDCEIDLYYGHIDGIRWSFGKRIKDRRNNNLLVLESKLLEKNYFLLEKEFHKELKLFKKYFKSSVLKKSIFYRARIGYKETVKDEDTIYNYMDENSGLKYIPYSDEDIGASPITKLSQGRLHRTGTSFLYLATDIETALTEVRPDPGHKVSIGCFKSIKKLKIADLDQAFIRLSKNEKGLEKYVFINHIDQLLSRPVTMDERYRYLITQFFSDAFRKLGFDGIYFTSSVGTGQNLLIFNPSNFEYIVDEANVYDINALKYQYAKIKS